MRSGLRHVVWIASSKKDFLEFPEDVISDIGYALYLAQCGDKSPSAKPLKGFGGASVLEVVEQSDGDTFRAVYTVRFDDGIYVLHCFQKKSKAGIATPKQDIDLIKARLHAAEEEHKRWEKEQRKS